MEDIAASRALGDHDAETHNIFEAQNCPFAIGIHAIEQNHALRIWVPARNLFSPPNGCKSAI